MKVKEIKKLIATAQLKEALEQMMTMLPIASATGAENLIDALKALEREDQLGIIIRSEFQTKYNDFTIKALRFLDKVPNNRSILDARTTSKLKLIKDQ